VPYRPPALFRQALALLRGVDAAAIARTCDDRAGIAARVHAARVAAVRIGLSNRSDEAFGRAGPALNEGG